VCVGSVRPSGRCATPATRAALDDALTPQRGSGGGPLDGKSLVVHRDPVRRETRVASSVVSRCSRRDRLHVRVPGFTSASLHAAAPATNRGQGNARRECAFTTDYHGWPAGMRLAEEPSPGSGWGGADGNRFETAWRRPRASFLAVDRTRPALHHPVSTFENAEECLAPQGRKGPPPGLAGTSRLVDVEVPGRGGPSTESRRPPSRSAPAFHSDTIVSPAARCREVPARHSIETVGARGRERGCGPPFGFFGTAAR